MGDKFGLNVRNEGNIRYVGVKAVEDSTGGEGQGMKMMTVHNVIGVALLFPHVMLRWTRVGSCPQARVDITCPHIAPRTKLL